MIKKEKLLEALKRVGEKLDAQGKVGEIPECLLAMKLISARIADTDLEDARFLMRKLEINTTEQAYEILEKYYPVERVLPKTKYFVEEILEEIGRE